MPNNKEIQFANNLQEDMIRRIEERIINDTVPKGPKDIWKPKNYAIDVARRNFQSDILNEWEKYQRKDPNERFRKQTTKDITEIKDAIRKIGIMFGEDAPSKEMMKKHKMLKDAYNKYKMIEALILGQDK